MIVGEVGIAFQSKKNGTSNIKILTLLDQQRRILSQQTMDIRTSVNREGNDEFLSRELY